MNRRKKLIIGITLTGMYLVAVIIAGLVTKNQAVATDFGAKNLPPSFRYPFGTDWLGRNMIFRTLTGLSLSVIIGLGTALLSTVIALVLAFLSSGMGKWADRIITFCVDLTLGIPHIILMILISVAAGRGLTGVILAISLTHWPSLTRILRGELLQLRNSGYIEIAKKLGKNRMYLVKKHLMPHLLPQVIVGFILTFPHAILHEATITFLGFGLKGNQPAIGVILSESMKYLIMGKWWLAVFPGIMLVITVLIFFKLGDMVRAIMDPATLHQ